MPCSCWARPAHLAWSRATRSSRKTSRIPRRRSRQSTSRPADGRVRPHRRGPARPARLRPPRAGHVRPDPARARRRDDRPSRTRRSGRTPASTRVGFVSAASTRPGQRPRRLDDHPAARPRRLLPAERLRARRRPSTSASCAEIIQSIRLTEAYPGDRGQAADHRVVPQQQLLREPQLRRRGGRPELLEEGPQGPHPGPVALLAGIPKSPTKFDLVKNAVEEDCTDADGKEHDLPRRPAQQRGHRRGATTSSTS